MRVEAALPLFATAVDLGGMAAILFTFKGGCQQQSLIVYHCQWLLVIICKKRTTIVTFCKRFLLSEEAVRIQYIIASH